MANEESKVFPKLLTIDEVAKLFRVSKATVYRMIESRILPFYKVTRAIRFAEEDVLKYLESQRVKPRDEWFFEAPHKSHPKTGS